MQISSLNPLNLRKKFGVQKARIRKKEQAIHFSFGEQDQIDLISYSGLEENSSYLLIGEKYVRTLFISGYPYVATTGWLNMLINFNYNTGK